MPDLPPPSGPPPGWYPDPENPGQTRWWNGKTWAQPTPAPGWYPDPKDSTRSRWWNGTSWADAARATYPTTSGGWSPTTKVVLVALIGVAVAVAVFGGDESRPGDKTATTSPESVSMWGGKYDRSVKVRIDGFEASGDCDALQAEFDIAVENDTITRNRWGSGTADLLDYIDEALRTAGCY